ncbi:hypothetical protein [Cellvibrio polysaccharolyticus]|uniref:Transcriptional regulator SutA RNAP-binding domain-containing protein n=1 Tax=Cellvibrio polysaccharolyticus TaxID=2082724 RepID=A0A928V4N6_9GAMM|nr:hypothetical protein [Cellvibrio polysaccharolyticus]MBE8716059.1 hypothetical protein [Cellvibrio polysaccharolyticus]
MTDEESINDDEVEEPLEDEEDTDDTELADSDDIVTTSSSSKAAAEVIDDFSIASRQRARDELDAQVAAFLARGGVINEVPASVTADPPKKPAPDYGGRPI